MTHGGVKDIREGEKKGATLMKTNVSDSLQKL